MTEPSGKVSSKYEGMKDEDVVLLGQNGDFDAVDYLLQRYKNLVTVKSRPYYLVGGDREDIIQEGMIGLYKAIREYDPARFPAFAGFASVKIQTQIINAVKHASRQKNIPLNTYVSLDMPIYEDENNQTLLDTLVAGSSNDPMELMIGQENLRSIQTELIPQLSPLESSVFFAFVEGRNYQEIASMLGRKPKTIDNALQRIRWKLSEILSANHIFIGTPQQDAKRSEARMRRKENVRRDARERARANAHARHRAEAREKRRQEGMNIRRKTEKKRRMQQVLARQALVRHRTIIASLHFRSW